MSSETRKSLLSLGGAFMVAALVATIIGCLAQTQINLAALTKLGAEIPFSLRLDVSVQDLLGFGPVYFAMVFAAFIPAFLLAHFLTRFFPQSRYLIFIVAGAVALLVTFKLVDAFAPMPTLIAATRDIGGIALMMAGGALGGWMFARRYQRGAAC